MVFDKDSAELEPVERLIVALDVSSEKEALDIVDDLGDSINFYKVGLQLFLCTYFSVVEELRKRDKHVFLDWKLMDIPTTIKLAITQNPEVDFIELMTIENMAQNLDDLREEGVPAKFLMLTVLSSVNDADTKAFYGEHSSIDSVVQIRSKRALEAGYDGLVAAGETVGKIRSEWFPASVYGDFLIVAPGIRPKGSSFDDHKRVLTPYEAMRDGADYIVVGRPITQKTRGRRKSLSDSIIEDIARGREEYEKNKDNVDGMLQVAVNL